MVRRVAVACLFGWACGLEAPVVNLASRDQSTEIPGAAGNLIVGRVPGAPAGTAVRLFLGTGGEVPEASAGTGVFGEPLAGTCDAGICLYPERCRWNAARVLPGVSSGAPPPSDGFAIRVPGTAEFRNLRVEARWPGAQRLSVIPEVNRQASVLDPEGCYLVGGAPEASTLDLFSTVATLILVGKALIDGQDLAAVPPAVVTQVLNAVRDSQDPAVTAFVALVRRLSDAAGQPEPDPCGLDGVCGLGPALYPFQSALGDRARVCDLLDARFLESFAPDVTCRSFVEALLAAEQAVRQSVQVCYAKDRIRVVFLADLRPGALDGNCTAVDPFRWASDLPGKTVFFTGGVHKTTPVCGRDGTPPACLTDAQVDEANQTLGNWVPNQIPMYDDGTHGDAVRGDKVFTRVLDLPFFDASLSADGRGVRIGYKYTYGLPGQGWTQTEEWPGNQRLLELVDVNADHLIVRMDVFGDEATNKDKANLLKPANGGCGVNLWENETRPGCAHDTRERMVDTDGDCVPDAWPRAGSVSPIVVECR